MGRGWVSLLMGPMIRTTCLCVCVCVCVRARAAAASCPEEAEPLPGTLSESYSLSPLLQR